ncbi:MAG: GtrA family protein [Candidatus Competibacter sp.]|nr:GtrA family protein [Candidatus Competibacter sp.]
MKSLSIFTPAISSGNHHELSPWRYYFDVIGECWRYFVASVLALGADFGIYIVGVELLHLHYLGAASLGFLSGLIIVYIFSITWVFSERNFNNKIQEFMFFVVIGITGLFINELILFLATDLLHFDYRISKVLSAGFVFCFNFVCRKALLFSSRKFIIAASKKLSTKTANA